MKEQQQPLDCASRPVVEEAETTLDLVAANDGHDLPPTAIPGWAGPIQHVTGSCKGVRVPRADQTALVAWLGALETDLVDPPNASDRSILGSLGRVALLELRLARECFNRGVIHNRTEVKAALPELRQAIRLKADLLARLHFRRDPRKVDSLRDTWGGAS